MAFIDYGNKFEKQLKIILKSYPTNIKEEIKENLKTFTYYKKFNLPLPKNFKDHPLNKNK